MKPEKQDWIPWTHGLYAWVGEGMNLPEPEFRKQLLSDPDWRGWLGNKDRYGIVTFSAYIEDDNSLRPIPDNFIAIGDDIISQGFKSGDRIKVTLERVEA